MKMPEKHDLLAYSRGKGTKRQGAILAFISVYRGRYNGGAFAKTVIGMMAYYRLVHS